MPDRHNPSEAVRSYLLGTLDERQAEALELKYFSDPKFFERVKNEEAELIEEYLQNRLPAPQKARFEKRYAAKIPALREKRAVRRPAFRWQYALAMLAVVLAVLLPWLRSRRPTPAGAEPQQTAMLSVHLTPGVVKGAAKQTEFTAPRQGSLRFTLELPGRTAPGDYVATLRMVDDPNQEAWRSPVLHSANQQVEFAVEATRLPPGDYLAQAETPDGAVIETYSFRVLQ